MTDHQKLVDFFMDELPEDSPWAGNVKSLVEKLIANGVTIQKWIPVTERLPEGNTDVLTFRKSGISVECRWSNHWDFDVFYDYPVTHWMPLPDPPKE